jgi:hypothetical protein
MKHNKLFITLALCIGFSSATSRAEQTSSSSVNWIAFGIGLLAGSYIGKKLGQWLKDTPTPTIKANPTVTYKNDDMTAMVSADMSNSPIAIELKNAHYSQGKIKEMRNRFQNDKITLDILNYVLVSWYVDRITGAIEPITIAANHNIARQRWLENLSSIFIVGIPAFKAGREGPALRYTDDGSELGMEGTKYQALRIVRNRLNEIPWKQNPQLPNGPDVIEFAQSL